MKNFARLALAAMMLALFSALALPAFAQEDPGEDGGVIIDSTFGSGPSTFSQVFCTDTACTRPVGFMYLGFLGVDPVAAAIVPGASDALVEDWTVSEDNLVYTFNLRQGLTWSDGTPITSADYMMDWELRTTPEAEHPYAYVTDVIADVQALDEYTIQVTFNDPACTALSYASLNVLPAHLYRQFIEEVGYEGLDTLEWNLAPTVTSGPFTFGESVANQTTSLIGNDAYPFAPLGYVAPYGYIQVVSADQTVQVEQLLNGEINVLEGPPVNRRADIRAAADQVQVYPYPGNAWDYFAFNLADPNNPQPAFDAEGNRIDQGLHPVLSDKLVRQGIAHAVDVDAMIQTAVFGEGSRMTSYIIPASWAYDSELPPLEYDVDLALELLAEAGWLPQDEAAEPSLENPLVCKGCLYATEVDPAYEGTPMAFDLITNEGNTRRAAIGAIIQDELGKIGITVNFQTIDFNTILEIMDAQSFDTIILGWRNGYPDDPDTTQLFGAASDDPGNGSNFTSFYNEEFDALQQEALNMPGCANEDRAPIYYEMQAIMQEELPYMWLFTQDGFYAARTEVSGFDPYPSQMFWNVTEWTVAN